MYTERPPAPPLARAVRAAWASRAVNGATTVRPDGCTDLIFHQSSSGHLTLRGRGVMTTPLQVSGDGGRRVALQLQPHAAGAFLREASAFRDAAVSAEAIWGAPARALTENVADLPDGAAHRALEAFVQVHLRPVDARVEYAVSQLERDGTRIDALAAHLNLSARQLTRLFDAHVGVSPRVLARTLRLERTLPPLRDPALPLVDVAAWGGYADQAHLTRECVALTGATPRAWRVRNLQDASGGGAAD